MEESFHLAVIGRPQRALIKKLIKLSVQCQWVTALSGVKNSVAVETEMKTRQKCTGCIRNGVVIKRKQPQGKGKIRGTHKENVMEGGSAVVSAGQSMVTHWGN